MISMKFDEEDVPKSIVLKQVGFVGHGKVNRVLISLFVTFVFAGGWSLSEARSESDNRGIRAIQR